MWDYAKLALVGLQIVKWLMDRYHDQQQYNAGQDHQIAEQAKSVLGMTVEGKRILEKLNAMSDSGLDDITDAIGNADKS